MECVCNGAIAQDEGGMDYCRIAVENSNLKIENKRLKDFISASPHLPDCYRKRMNEKAKGVDWPDLPCICGRDDALKGGE